MQSGGGPNNPIGIPPDENMNRAALASPEVAGQNRPNSH
jgi:hypothetical protein